MLVANAPFFGDRYVSGVEVETLSAGFDRPLGCDLFDKMLAVFGCGHLVLYRLFGTGLFFHLFCAGLGALFGELDGNR